MQMIEDKIHRLISAQNTLKENFKKALQSIGVNVSDDLLLKDYPKLIETINTTPSSSDPTTLIFKSSDLVVDNAAQGGSLGSNIPISADNIELNKQTENLEFN